jgi:hypothetical protein
MYVKQSNNLLKKIKIDEAYLEDLIMDCLSESSQVKIRSLKKLVDESNQNFEEFKGIIRNLLEISLKKRKAEIATNDKQHLITICYIKSAIEILNNLDKYERDAMEL